MSWVGRDQRLANTPLLLPVFIFVIYGGGMLFALCYNIYHSRAERFLSIEGLLFFGWGLLAVSVAGVLFWATLKARKEQRG